MPNNIKKPNSVKQRKNNNNKIESSSTVFSPYLRGNLKVKNEMYIRFGSPPSKNYKLK